MAETHPHATLEELQRRASLSVAAQFREWNEAAIECAKSLPSPAVMPSLNHLRMVDYHHVYEPSEDTFLLLDALWLEFGDDYPTGSSTLGASASSLVTTTLELGCGTGVATIYLAQQLRDRRRWERLHYVTDINPEALRVTQRTAVANGFSPHFFEAIQCDLASPLLARCSGSIDVLLFNPPYVPTPDDEVVDGVCNGNVDWIEASWAGGERGRRVMDRAFSQMACLLAYPHGVAYMITVDDNVPEEIHSLLLERYGLLMQPLLRKRARNEFLTVQKITHVKKQEEDKNKGEDKRGK